MSFELVEGIDAMEFQNQLNLIKSSMSLAGVESTMLLPSETSHALLTQDERGAVGISNQLIRFSVGIETFRDLKSDIKQALTKSKTTYFA